MRELTVHPSPLSTIASVVWRLMQRESETFEEGRAFGAPMDELAPIIHQAAVNELLIEFARHGWSPRDFLEELEERTSERWAYFSGLAPYVAHSVGDLELKVVAFDPSIERVVSRSVERRHQIT